jgi:hypothetical protein
MADITLRLLLEAVCGELFVWYPHVGLMDWSTVTLATCEPVFRRLKLILTSGRRRLSSKGSTDFGFPLWMPDLNG